ncbi:MAG: hypothetical protein DDG60_12020 [Anaerolineae bacterium]|nr:MAG: hypothetical protein DDG60_12020 [Anaerolineae bacterium]
MKRFCAISPCKIIPVLWVFLLLTGCGLLSEAESKPNAPLRVEFAEWWGDYTLIIAEKNGLFEKYGVAVTPVFYSNFSRALPDLAAGQIDGGLFAIGDAISVSKYTDLKVVAVYDNGSYNTIVSVPDIKRIRDLTGKRVGVQVGTSYELLINEMLASAGMNMSDIILVNINPEDVPDNLGKTIDAGFVYEPYTSIAIAKGNSLLIKSQDFVGLYPDVIVFRADVVNKRSEDIRAFLKAWFEAVEFRRRNPQESLQIIANHLGKPTSEISIDTSLEIFSIEDNYDIFQAQPARRRSIYQTARLNADFLVRIGVLPARPNLNLLLSPEFLP